MRFLAIKIVAMTRAAGFNLPKKVECFAAMRTLEKSFREVLKSVVRGVLIEVLEKSVVAK